MIRLTLSEKDYDTLKLAMSCLRNSIADWFRQAEDRESIDHYAALHDDANDLQQRINAAEEVTL